MSAWDAFRLAVMSAVMAAVLLPDALWDLIEPLLPASARRPNGGRLRVSDRTCLTGILFVLRSGIRGGCYRRDWAPGLA
jgi:transposase